MVSGPVVLEVLEVGPGDAGIYECLVDNGGRPMIQTHQIILSSPARVSGCSHRVTAATGSVAEFQCSGSGHPPPVLSWSRAGRVLEMERGRNGSFLLGSLSLADSGLYTCTARNSDEGGEGGQCNTTLVVMEPPLVSIQSTWTVYSS